MHKKKKSDFLVEGKKLANEKITNNCWLMGSGVLTGHISKIIFQCSFLYFKHTLFFNIVDELEVV